MTRSMPKKILATVLLAVLPLLPVMAVQAGDAKDARPGLWELQHKTAVDGQALPDMDKMLQQVPPEMRGQVEAMMAKNGAGLKGKNITICLTAEQIAKQEYGGDPQSQCKVSDVKTEGNVTHMKMQCSRPKGQGETSITHLSPESWSSTTKMTVEEAGSSHTVNSESTARWVSADCGAVKPVGQK